MTGAARTTIGKLTQGGPAPRRRRGLEKGRTTTLTPELSKRICDAVRAGNYVSVAARYCGVSEKTLFDWLQRGRGEHPTRSASRIFVDFVRDLDAAEAGGEVAAVLHWRAAMPKDWHSAEKWLKVRQPERWAEKTPDQLASGAFAGVQVNIGVGGTAGGQPTTPQSMQMPLAALLEDNPELIEGTMQFLDALLPPDGGAPDVNSTENTVIEAESGSWVEVEDDQ